MPVKTPRPFGPELSTKQEDRLRGIWKIINSRKRPPKPLTLQGICDYYGFNYSELALLVGASDRSHAWRMAVGTNRPRWDYLRWMIGELDGLVSLETLTDLSKR